MVHTFYLYILFIIVYCLFYYYVLFVISAVKQSIATNRIQKSFCLHNICMSCVYLLCIYKYTHILYIFENIYMYLHVYIYIIYIIHIFNI